MIAFWVVLMIAATVLFVGYPLLESTIESEAAIEEEVARLRKKQERDRELFCPDCGADYRPKDKFCQHCGSRLNDRRSR